MPIYPFRCPSGHIEEHILPMTERDSTTRRCVVCHKTMTRVMAAFGIAKEHASHRMYEHEQEKWALATGQKHETPADLERWAEENGKSILAPGETVKKKDLTPSDDEIEKALDQVYEKNHDCGTIVTNTGKLK